MEHIVLGFDGTEPSLVALDWVAERAARGACRIEIVTIGDHVPDMVIRDAEQRITDRAADADVIWRRLSGRMPDSLLRAAEDADLLVIGARRRRPVRSALTGWLPVRTVSRSHVPTVVVPNEWTVNDGPVVVGVDDDHSSSAAVPFAAIEAEASGGSLSLLHAWQMPIPTTEGAGALLASPTHVKDAHREVLDRAGEAIADEHPALTLEKSLVQDSPSSALVARSARSSLIVLGTHQRGLLESAILGSVCQDVLASSLSPVCVVPATSSGS
ncbi:universal stress protein [Microbacterium pumilum]|uniref:Universal stress protein n=1 Tax=Microbacterium pumilum TaxID=344165 RepID=A0ABN2RS87_9MICO